MQLDKQRTTKKDIDRHRSALSLYMADLRGHPNVDHEQTIELFKEYSSTTDAKTKQRLKQRLLETNLRLVVAIAKKYRKFTSMPLIDLIQEGNIGLMKGIERFDWTRGFHLSTYASWWIRQGILRYIQQQKHLIRMPVHATALQSRVRQFVAEYKHKHDGAEPDVDVISDALDASKLLVNSVLQSSTHQMSFQAEAKNDVLESTSVLSQVDSDNDPSQVVLTKEMVGVVQSVLDTLSTRELAIVRLRFGLVEQNPEQFAQKDEDVSDVR